MTATLPESRSTFPSRWIVANGGSFRLAQHELAAPDGRLGGRAAEADASGANEFLDAVWADELLERVDLLRHAGELEDEGIRPEVGDARLEDLAEGHQLAPPGGWSGDLDQRELPLDRVAWNELRDPEHVDELVHLLLDLRERRVVAIDAQRDPRDLGLLGRTDGQALDVEATAREHVRDPGEHARLVLDEDGERVRHCTTASCSPGNSTRSRAAAPAGIIGKQCSCGSTRQSTTDVRPQSIASASVSSGDEAAPAVSLGECRVVRQVMGELDLREALLEEHVLPLPDHAEMAVVDEDDDDREALVHRRRQLLLRHLEAAVAVDADDGRVRARGLGADRGRDPVPHRAEAARGDERAGAVAEEVLHRPHLVLSDAG